MLRKLKGEPEVAFGDKDFMPFGKHQGKALANVPATYLLWWYNKIMEQNTVIGGIYMRLKLYVEENLDLLKAEKDKSLTTLKNKNNEKTY